MEYLQTAWRAIDWDVVAPSLIRIVVVILSTALISFLIVKVLKRVELSLIKRGLAEGEVPSESRKRAHTLMGLARQALTLVAWLLAILIILQEVDVEIGPLLAGAGIAGLALGFGAQNLVRDFFAGFFLVLENQVRVGDAVRVNGTWGVVEELNFRTLVIRDLTGEVHIFPNGMVNTLSNLSHEWSAHVFELGVAYKENTDRVTQIIAEVGAELRSDEGFGSLIIEELEIFGISNFADSAVIIKGRIKTKPLKQWIVGREFNRRIKLAFDEHGIEIPFPHRTLYFGEASKPFELLQVEGPGDSEKQTGSENS